MVLSQPPSPLYQRFSLVADQLRFPLSCLVVFIHVMPDKLLPITLQHPGAAFTEIVSHIIGRIAVPCFFLFSGYYFFYNKPGFTLSFYKQQLLRRSRSILMPYLIFNTLVIAVPFIIMAGTRIFHLHIHLAQPPLTSAALIQYYWYGPANYPLWYMRDLMCMSIISPLLYIFLRYTKIYGITALCLLYLSTADTHITGFSITAILYFSLGMYMAVQHTTILHMPRMLKIIIVITAIVSCTLAGIHSSFAMGEFYTRIFVLSGTLALITGTSYLLAGRHVFSAGLAQAGFFIYVSHSIYIINWLKGAWVHFTGQPIPPVTLPAYFILPVTCIIICMAIYYILHTTMPSLLSFITGGRLKAATK